MDEVFGEDNYINEIIWQKIRSSKGQANSFGNVHDTIFCYAKSQEYFFKRPYAEHEQERIDQHFNNFDEKISKHYQLADFTQRGQGEARRFGKYGLLKPPAGKHWIWTQEKIDKGMADGTIVFTSKGKPRVKRYLEPNSAPIEDLWIDISPINSQSDERTDYATQKPEALLKRIIEASSDNGMIVADFFGGSGVTAKVAHDLGRTFIHADVGINSIQTTRDRLKLVKSSFEILEVKDGVSLFRNPAQTMDKLHSLIPGLGKVSELSNFWAGGIHDSKKGLMPVFLPNLLDHTQKILDKPLLNRILNEALPDLPDEVKQVIVYFVDLEDKKELEKFIQEYNPTDIKVELRDLKEVLHEIVTNDEVEYKVSKGKEGTTIEFTRFYSDRLMQKIDAYNQKRGLNGNSKKKQIELDEVNGDENEENENQTAFKPIEVSENGLELIELVSLDGTSAKGKWNSDKEIKIDKKGFVIRDGEKSKEFWDGKITSKEKPLRLKVRNIAGDESIILL